MPKKLSQHHDASSGGEEGDPHFMSIAEAKELARRSREAAAATDDEVDEGLMSEETAELLEKHCENLAYKGRVAWIDTLAIDVDATVPSTLSVDADIEREKAFEEIALKGVQEGLKRLEALGVDIFPPHDFCAEMLRTDVQMTKVKNRTAAEQARIKAIEERKKARLQKKFAKQTKVEKLREKQQKKKKSLKEIEEIKKAAKKNQD